MAERFVLHTDTDVENFLDVEENKNTKTKTVDKKRKRWFWRFSRLRKRIDNLKICHQPNWIPT